MGGFLIAVIRGHVGVAEGSSGSVICLALSSQRELLRLSPLRKCLPIFLTLLPTEDPDEGSDIEKVYETIAIDIGFKLKVWS